MINLRRSDETGGNKTDKTEQEKAMKKTRWLVLPIMGMLLTGCGKADVDADIDRAAGTIAEGSTSEKAEMPGETAAEGDAAEETSQEADGNTEDTVAFETKCITIDLSTAKEMHREGNAATPLQLKIISEKENGIDWAYEWYENMDLSLPMIGDTWDSFYDDEYEYYWIGDELDIYEKETGNCLYVLNYRTDKWYVNGNNAYLKDGIFYGASVMNGYAQPDTCFMFAYDLEQNELLWRSADQSYNSMNFVVKGDVILCGYGFTEEKDYLYQIDRNTGEILDRLALKKMPDLLVEQDGKLYVHTYSYDYVIEMD